VRTGSAADATSMTEAGLAAVLATFDIARVSVCTYEQPELRAEVLAIETGTPEDAFGIFSLLADGIWIFRGDRSIRAQVEAAAPVWYGWQGHSLIRVRGEGRINPQTEKALADLLGRIIFYIPATDAPLLARTIPPASRVDSRIWVVRDLRPLREHYTELFGTIDAKALNERLGLTGEAMISVARVRQEPSHTEELIWLAQYPNATAAQNAHTRYRQALNDSDDKGSLLLEPRDVFVVGGWSGQSEQVQRMLKELREALPIEPTQP